MFLESDFVIGSELWTWLLTKYVALCSPVASCANASFGAITCGSVTAGICVPGAGKGLGPQCHLLGRGFVIHNYRLLIVLCKPVRLEAGSSVCIFQLNS